MGQDRMPDDYEHSRRRLRALKSGWRARHQNRVHIDPEIAPEYNRRFYAALHRSEAPAFELLAHLDQLGA